MWYIGADGGGTKTAFTVYNNELAPVASAFVLSTMHYAQVGFDGLERVLTEGIEHAKGLIPQDENYGIGLGLAGYGSVPEVRAEIERRVSRIAAGHVYKLVSDVEAAHAASLGLQDGIILIAGTGSIAYGKYHHKSARVGGWGPLIGDEGSGYWIAKELLREFSAQSDGRQDRTLLYSLVRAHLSCTDDFNLISYVQNPKTGSRTELARLAPIVFKAAAQHDICAERIIHTAISHYVLHVKALIKKLGFQLDICDNSRELSSGASNINISYVGGVFKAGGLVLEPLSQALPSYCKLRKPLREPDVGACLLLKEELDRIN